ncbi:hypothetical protein BX600DRAFT_310802 [Xylariales sp. PMI_506]|nr:hypothetical protein BX600DRAFT_310802 [Xylariales sp. PMI_506]
MPSPFTPPPLLSPSPPGGVRPRKLHVAQLSFKCSRITISLRTKNPIDDQDVNHGDHLTRVDATSSSKGSSRCGVLGSGQRGKPLPPSPVGCFMGQHQAGCKTHSCSYYTHLRRRAMYPKCPASYHQLPSEKAAVIADHTNQYSHVGCISSLHLHGKKMPR